MANQLTSADIKDLLQSIGNDVNEIKEMVSYHTALTVAEEAASKEAANAAAKVASNKTAKAAANAAAKAAAKAAANALAGGEEREEIEIDGQLYLISNNYLYEYEPDHSYVGRLNINTGTINMSVPEPTPLGDKVYGGRRKTRRSKKGKKRSYRKRK